MRSLTALDLLNVALAAIDVLLALALGWIYWRNHQQLRSPFTLGLLLFAAFLVVHNGLAVYHFVTMMDTMSAKESYLVLAENVLQTGAVGALLAATMR